MFSAVIANRVQSGGIWFENCYAESEIALTRRH
jgi:hypothetical protein